VLRGDGVTGIGKGVWLKDVAVWEAGFYEPANFSPSNGLSEGVPACS